MSMTFSGQVALVTGAAAGIGRATALAFAQQGLKVVLADIDEAGIRDGAEIIRAAGGEAIAVRCDVTRDEQVKALIEQSANEVDGGSKLVAEAASKLSDILSAVRENSELMQGISEANREQTTAIGEVRTAVQQMDEMTQHNAALVEETNAAIEQTEAQASELDRVVAIFTIDKNTAIAEEPAVPQAARKPEVAKAARSYLTSGNTALKDDWSEF